MATYRGKKLKYPGKDKRPVYVDILSWVGHSPGATHYRVKVHEDYNSYWSPKDNAWVTIYGRGHEELMGKSFEERFDCEEKAYRWARVTIRENFSSKTHKVVSKKAGFTWRKKEVAPTPCPFTSLMAEFRR